MFTPLLLIHFVLIRYIDSLRGPLFSVVLLNHGSFFRLTIDLCGIPIAMLLLVVGKIDGVSSSKLVQSIS